MFRKSDPHEITTPSTAYDTTRRKRVLIVEDDGLIALALQDIVQDAGFEVVGPASDLDSGMRLVQHGAIDAAILDYWLHGVTARTITEALAAQRIPFALTTGFGVGVIGRTHGAACVVAKPYTLEDIHEVLSRLMAPLTHARLRCGDEAMA